MKLVHAAFTTRESGLKVLEPALANGRIALAPSNQLSGPVRVHGSVGLGHSTLQVYGVSIGGQLCS